MVNILQLTVRYPNATITRNTRSPELEIGTETSSETRQNTRVDGYRSGCSRLRGSRSGFRTRLEPNRPLANTNEDCGTHQYSVPPEAPSKHPDLLSIQVTDEWNAPLCTIKNLLAI